MKDDPKPKPDRSLSEISHLFLSSVRERHTNGAPRPQRRPPGPRTDATVDLTPEEFAEVFGEPETAAADADDRPTVSAVIAGHLVGEAIGSVRMYARHLAAQGNRIGLVVVDAGEFQLAYFDQDGSESTAAVSATPREIAEAIEELTFEIDRWLVLLPNPRMPEARALLADIEHWTLLATCDHDGVVASYRALKGLSDLRRPALSLALLDAASDTEAARVFRKMAGVCQQFLNWPVHAEPLVRPAPQITEHAVGIHLLAADADPSASAVQWQLMTEFVTKWQQDGAEAADVELPKAAPLPENVVPPAPAAPVEPRQHIADVIVAESPRPQPLPIGPMSPSLSIPAADVTEVVELQDAGAPDESILASVLRHARGEIVECPVQPPMCPQARLAVGRDSRLVMLAIAKQGLGELNAIGQAYRWMSENRALIRMAVPQLAINDAATPGLRLFVDHADVTANVLQPMLQTENVTVQAYRRLRWGGKTGLLLEAA